MLYKGICFVLQGGLTLAHQNMIDPSNTISYHIFLNLLCSTRRIDPITAEYDWPQHSFTPMVWRENAISYHIFLNLQPQPHFLTNIHLQLLLSHKFVRTKIFLAQTFLPHYLPTKMFVFLFLDGIPSTFSAYTKTQFSPDCKIFRNVFFLHTFVICKHWDRQYWAAWNISKIDIIGQP